jgi:hypothetical protein
MVRPRNYCIAALPFSDSNSTMPLPLTLGEHNSIPVCVADDGKMVQRTPSCYVPSWESGRDWGKMSKQSMSKQAMREETERLVREVMAKKSVTVKQGNTRIETRCGKCGAPNRVLAAKGEGRPSFTCKECGHKQKTL